MVGSALPGVQFVFISELCTKLTTRTEEKMPLAWRAPSPPGGSGGNGEVPMPLACCQCNCMPKGIQSCLPFDLADAWHVTTVALHSALAKVTVPRSARTSVPVPQDKTWYYRRLCRHGGSWQGPGVPGLQARPKGVCGIRFLLLSASARASGSAFSEAEKLDICRGTAGK